MEITHVLRADEWIPSAPIQVALYAAFGWQEPVWVHVPLVLNPGGKGKLAKRKTVDSAGNAVELMTQVREFRSAGYLPEAVFNYLALQGWSFGAEEDVFSREEALAAFRVEDIRSSPAAWSPDKLAWMNGVYIRKLDAVELARRLAPFLKEEGLEPRPEELAAVIPLIQERIVTLRDAADLVRFFWTDVAPGATDLVPAKLGAEGAAAVLASAATALGETASWDHASIEAALRAAAERLGVKPREAFQPVRVALTGSLISPPLFESAELLGRDLTLARLHQAAATLTATAPV
jgi:glutamyl-tRNA synthetase